MSTNILVLGLTPDDKVPGFFSSLSYGVGRRNVGDAPVFEYVVGSMRQAQAAENGAVTKTGGGPNVTLTGTPVTTGEYVVEITTGGAVGTAAFRWSKDGGVTWITGVATAPSCGLAVVVRVLHSNLPATTEPASALAIEGFFAERRLAADGRLSSNTTTRLLQPAALQLAVPLDLGTSVDVNSPAEGMLASCLRLTPQNRVASLRETEEGRRNVVIMLARCRARVCRRRYG